MPPPTEAQVIRRLRPGDEPFGREGGFDREQVDGRAEVSDLAANGLLMRSGDDVTKAVLPVRGLSLAEGM